MKGDYEEFHALRHRKNKANQSQFQNVAGGDLDWGFVFSRLKRKGPMKEFMDFFRKTAGYDIDLRRKIA